MDIPSGGVADQNQSVVNSENEQLKNVSTKTVEIDNKQSKNTTNDDDEDAEQEEGMESSEESEDDEEESDEENKSNGVKKVDDDKENETQVDETGDNEETKMAEIEPTDSKSIETNNLNENDKNYGRLRRKVKKSYKFENCGIEDDDPEEEILSNHIEKNFPKKSPRVKGRQLKHPSIVDDENSASTEKKVKLDAKEEQKAMKETTMETEEEKNVDKSISTDDLSVENSDDKKVMKTAKKYFCAPCNLNFKKKKNYRKHFEANPACNPFTCKVCFKTCKNMSYLHKHMVTHTGERPFSCDTCQKNFSFSKQLREHKTSNSHIAKILQQTGGADLLVEECKLCTKKFESQDILNAHFSLFHSEGAKNKLEKRKGKHFMCDDCGAMCSTNAKLKIHKRTHTKEKPYRCPYCDKSYGHDISLTRHIMTHTGDRPYICDLCGKSFNRPHNLKLHMSTHTGVRAYNCDICGKGFNQRGTLLVHKNKVHESDGEAVKNRTTQDGKTVLKNVKEDSLEPVITVQVQDTNVHELNIAKGDKVHNVIIPQVQVSMGQSFQLPEKIDWTRVDQGGQQQESGSFMIQNNLGNDVGIYIRMDGDQLRQINQHPSSVANDIVISYPDESNDVQEDVEYYFDGNYQPPNIASNIVTATNYHDAQQHQSQQAQPPAVPVSGEIQGNRIQAIVENEEDKNLAIAAMTELQYKFLKNTNVSTDDYQQQTVSKHDHVTTEHASGYYETAHLDSTSSANREDGHSYLRSTLTTNPSYQYQVYNSGMQMYVSRDSTPSSQISGGNAVGIQMPENNIAGTIDTAQISMLQNYQATIESSNKQVEQQLVFERDQMYSQQKYSTIPQVQATYESETYLAAETLHQMDQTGANIHVVSIEAADLEQQKGLPAPIILKPEKGKKMKKIKKVKRARRSEDGEEEVDMSNLHTCDLCDAKFEELAEYKKHMEMHVPNMAGNYKATESLVCDICKETFTDSLLFSEHIGNHAKHRALQCKICDEYFNNKRGLFKHMAYHIGMTSEFPCNICDTVFKTHREFKVHFKEHHLGEDQIQCDMCEKMFNYPKDLKQHHLKEHGGKKNFKCPTCNKSYFTYYELQKHKVIHESTSLHTCHICNKSYKWKHDFRRHVKSHTAIKLFPCVVCDKVFSRKVGYNEHLISAIHRVNIQKNPESGFKLSHACENCDGKYESEEVLKFHQLKEHNPEKESTSIKRVRNFQYVCTECGVVFRMSAHLKNHMRTHTKEKPFQCETCGKKFRFDIDFRRHRLDHTGERPFMCDTCGKTFNRKANLRLHSVIHTGEKQFVCDLCGEAFIQNSGLQYHRKKVHGLDKPYICKECGEGFQYNKQLRFHTNAIHKANQLVPRLKALKNTSPAKVETESQPEEGVNSKNLDILQVLIIQQNSE